VPANGRLRRLILWERPAPPGRFWLLVLTADVHARLSGFPESRVAADWLSLCHPGALRLVPLPCQPGGRSRHSQRPRHATIHRTFGSQCAVRSRSSSRGHCAAAVSGHPRVGCIIAARRPGTESWFEATGNETAAGRCHRPPSQEGNAGSRQTLPRWASLSALAHTGRKTWRPQPSPSRWGRGANRTAARFSPWKRRLARPAPRQRVCDGS